MGGADRPSFEQEEDDAVVRDGVNPCDKIDADNGWMRGQIRDAKYP